MQQLMFAYAVAAIALSIATFVTYGFDKRSAQRDRRRVPEKTLHLMALFGGWPGALVGQQLFRHKTQKTSFQIVFWMCVAANVALLAATFYFSRALV